MIPSQLFSLVIDVVETSARSSSPPVLLSSCSYCSLACILNSGIYLHKYIFTNANTMKHHNMKYVDMYIKVHTHARTHTQCIFSL